MLKLYHHNELHAVNNTVKLVVEPPLKKEANKEALVFVFNSSATELGYENNSTCYMELQ